MTKEQLLKFIELRSRPGMGGAMQNLLDAATAGFNFSDLPKPTYCEDNSSPSETPYGIMSWLKGRPVLRDFTPEEQAELDGRAARLAKLPRSALTSRESDWLWHNMTPEEQKRDLRKSAIASAANRQRRLARGIPEIDWGQATVDALRRATREE
jgi:aminoglycoside phosphotransferase (APT) family kinase protein